MVLGSRPTVYFQSRHSEPSAPPRAQIVKKGTQGKEMSQLAGSTEMHSTLNRPQTLRGGPEWWTIGKIKPASLFMLAPASTSILCLFSLVPLTPDWMLTLILFLAPHHLAHGSPITTLCPSVSPWAAPTLPSDCLPALSSQWYCTTSSSSSFIFQETICPGLHSASVFCLPFASLLSFSLSLTGSCKKHWK